MKTDIEKLFLQESREKKRVGRGIYNRASRRGFIKGGVKTQYDFMTTKEKKKLNGEVKVYHMYDLLENVPKVEYFKTIDKEKARKDLIIIKNNFSNKELREHWKINNYTLYKTFKSFGVPLESKNNKKKEKVDTNKEIVVQQEVAVEEIKKEEVSSELDDYKMLLNKVLDTFKNTEVVDTFEKKNSFRIEFNGCFSKQEIEDRLINLTGTMIASKSYKINFVLEEIDTSNKSEFKTTPFRKHKQEELRPSNLAEIEIKTGLNIHGAEGDKKNRDMLTSLDL